ncbi:MAG: TonB-dependent receptor plug domain-containing protein [Gemmatimonadales bacterium]|nr:TonB-dependent receptor plug domain-containing protein [Gemmatimonadales bacterium]
MSNRSTRPASRRAFSGGGRLTGRAILLVLVSLVVVPLRLSAQESPRYTFVASVFDAMTREPVIAAFAAALGTDRFATTDQNGSFRLTALPRGTHTIRIWRLGYRPTMFTVRFDSLETNVLDVPIVLEPVPVEMPEVVVEADRTRLVTGAMREFYRRRDEGLGWFMTHEQIEARVAESLDDLVRSVPGVNVQYLGNFRVTIRMTTAQCPVVYFVDGIQSNEQLALSIRPERMAGIEVYRRPAEVPPELNVRGASCGVIVIWTRQ